MKRNINYKTGYKKVVVADIIRVLLLLHNQIPEGQALTPEESVCSGRDIMLYGSDKYYLASVQKHLGAGEGNKVFISSKDLTTFADYLIEQFKDSNWVDSVTVGLFTHKNQAPVDEQRNCKTMEADFAEVKLIAPDKTIKMFINYKDLLTKKIGTYVEVHDTSWKKLKPIEEGQNKRDWILDRIVVEAAIIAEDTERKFKTKEEFLKYFNSVHACEPSEVISNITKFSKTTRDGGMRFLNMRDVNTEEKVRTLKMFYNKLKNDTLKVKVAEGKEDKTHVELVYNGRRLGLWISFKDIIIEYEG